MIAVATGSAPGDGSWWSVTTVSIPRERSSAMTSCAEVPLSTDTTTLASQDSARLIECAPNEYAAAEGSDLLVLATEWNQFRKLDLQRIRELLAKPVVVDLRNIYEPTEMRQLGFQYVGVGR